MTLREMYEAIGNTDIPWDAQVEFKNGELVVVGPANPLPPAPEDKTPEPVGSVRTSRGLFRS